MTPNQFEDIYNDFVHKMDLYFNRDGDPVCWYAATKAKLALDDAFDEVKAAKSSTYTDGF